MISNRSQLDTQVDQDPASLILTDDDCTDDLGACLRALPGVPFKRAALDDVLSRTVHAMPASRQGRARTPVRPSRSALAAAALVAITAVGAWLAVGSRGTGGDFSETELARLERELALAMSVLGGALASAEHITVDDALTGGTAGALRYMPLTGEHAPANEPGSSMP